MIGKWVDKRDDLYFFFEFTAHLTERAGYILTNNGKFVMGFFSTNVVVAPRIYCDGHYFEICE